MPSTNLLIPSLIKVSMQLSNYPFSSHKISACAIHTMLSLSLTHSPLYG